MLEKRHEFVVPVLCAVAFVCIASAHRLQIDDFDAYRNSVLIPVEFLLFIASLAGLVVVFCSSIIGVFKRQWKRVMTGVLCTIVIFTLIAASMVIDATTLVYMT